LDYAIRSRFEEDLKFEIPNKKERLEMLRYYCGLLPLPICANLNKYALKTSGFSGRDIKEKLLKAALYKAILENSDEVSEAHLDESLKEINLALSKPPGEMFT
jgi:AAA family ATPase